MYLALKVFFWLVVTVVAVVALGLGVMALLANMMSDAAPSPPNAVERFFNRAMEWVSKILRRGKP